MTVRFAKEEEAEQMRAYESCNTRDVMQNTYLDVTKYFQVTLPVEYSTKAGDCKELAVSTISNMIVGKTASTDETWAKFRTEWENRGGVEVYNYFTQLYENAKGDLSFLNK